MWRRCLMLLALMAVAACHGLSPSAKPRMAQITAAVETTPVASAGDAADDPAIWVHPHDASKSLILGTDKRRGLAVYNLQGQQLQFLAQGKLNNVDVRQTIVLSDGAHDMAVATNRSTNSLDIFSISADGQLSVLLSQPVALAGLYGLCLQRRSSGELVAFVNSKDGWYQQWLLTPAGTVAPVLEGEFLIASQPEGCVVDDASATLYFGEESLGVWKMPADYRAADRRVLIDTVSGNNLQADVEGMAIYHHQHQRVLIVSSQGDSSFALYNLNDDSYIGSVRIAANKRRRIDGVQDTDGVAVSSANFGGVFEHGVLVVQDGNNSSPPANQNFKVVPWSELMRAVLTAD